MIGRFIAFSFFLFLILFSSACEDPSNVGLALIDDQGGAPVFTDLQAATFESMNVRDITGNATRILAGVVEDPFVGDISAAGFFDFIRPATVSSAYASGQVTSASLFLRPDYLYGDSTATITMTLRDITEEMFTTGARADTTIEAGDPILDFTFEARDTVVVISLPDGWINDNDVVLRTAGFDNNFHGFYLEPVSGNAIVGFTRASSLLRASTGTDSTDFLITGTLSMLEHTAPVALPPDRHLVQDGLGSIVGFTFDMEDQDAEAFNLNRVEIRVPADTLLSTENTPQYFHRPSLTQLSIYGITEEGLALNLESSFIDENGVFVFSSDIVRNTMKLILEEDDAITRFELRVPSTGDNTINVQVLHGLDSSVDSPTSLITMTPLY